MKLIKCNHCGRPFYDSEKLCPYCGHAASLSAGNLVRKSISDPRSHKLMEDMLSGNYRQQPVVTHAAEAPEYDPEPMQVQTPSPEEEVPDTLVVVVEEAVEHPSEAATEESTPSDSVLDRASGIASATANKVESEEMQEEERPAEVETEHPKKKRRGWIWIIVLVVVLALAAAVYLKWDVVYSTAMSIIGK